jgi:cytochrome c
MSIQRSGFGAWLCVLLCGACGGADKQPDGRAGETGAGAGLTADQLEKGVGPIDHLALDSIDPALVALGDEIFAMKCAACHQMDARYVGPALGNIVEQRSPEYIMNMMLNPAEMLERHPTARQLLAEYYTPMPSQDLTTEDARALLEYLRHVHAEATPEATPTGAGP